MSAASALLLLLFSILLPPSAIILPVAWAQEEATFAAGASASSFSEETVVTPPDASSETKTTKTASTTTAEDADADEEASETQQQSDEDRKVVVDDYLQSLSNEELETICRDRGFEIASPDNGQPLTREDYVEGARRCLTLENEMNAILAESPELAAELDKEIIRMKLARERLEEERDAILAEKELLERQLRDAGVDIGSRDDAEKQKQFPSTRLKKDPADMSFEEVMKESLTQLYERVMLDVKMVVKILEPVLKPLFRSLKLVWKYARPTFAGAWERIRDLIEKQLTGGASKGGGGGGNGGSSEGNGNNNSEKSKR